MTDEELQQAAREAISETTQAEAARQLGVSKSNISLALNHEKPSRYAKTLKDIIGRFAGFHIESETIHRVAGKA